MGIAKLGQGFRLEKQEWTRLNGFQCLNNLFKFQDEMKINCELLIAADKYNIHGLLDVCAGYLEENLSLENGLDIMISVSCEQSTKTIV